MNLNRKLILFPLFSLLIGLTMTVQGQGTKSELPNKVDSVKLETDLTKKGRDITLNVEFEKRVVVYLSGPTEAFTQSDNDRIYINDTKMPYPVVFNCPCENSKDTTKKYFTLTFTVGKHDTSWNKWYGFGDSMLSVRLDAGTKDKVLTCSTDRKLSVKMYNPSSLVWSSVFVAVFLFLTLILAFWKGVNLIRDRSSSEKKPYSLSRFQLLWWSAIIVSCYILLFAIRDDFALLSQSTLILLGISAAGTGFAQLVEYSDADKDRHQDQPGVNFLVDTLSDDNGISIHRFQNFVFTIVFGIVFVYKVFSTGNMPDFGVLELSLMGLSTATYVGLKTNENNNPSSTDTGPAPNQNIVG